MKKMLLALLIVVAFGVGGFLLITKKTIVSEETLLRAEKSAGIPYEADGIELSCSFSPGLSNVTIYQGDVRPFSLKSATVASFYDHEGRCFIVTDTQEEALSLNTRQASTLLSYTNGGAVEIREHGKVGIAWTENGVDRFYQVINFVNRDDQSVRSLQAKLDNWSTSHSCGNLFPGC